MTLLDIINGVLLDLREEPATTTADNEYVQLLGSFVNRAKHIIEGAAQWQGNMVFVNFQMEAGKSVYDLTADAAGGGDVFNGSQTLDSRAILQRDGDSLPVALAKSSADDNWRQMYEMNPMTLQSASLKRATNVPTLTGREYPEFFSVQNVGTGVFEGNVNVGPQIRFWGKPATTGEYVFRIWFNQPMPDYKLDGSEDAKEIRIPTDALRLGALLFALNERGEEIGEPGNIAERNFQDALGQAKEAESYADQFTDFYEAVRT